jgi:uncharacterized UPF0160 family protein
MDKKITIVTHDVHFHADEICAVAALELFLGEKNVTIIRSRNEEIIESGDYVIDVGGVYDPKTHRFDHHQSGGAGSRENGVAYASFGLIWKEIGEKLCGSQEVAAKIDKKLVQPIDLEDNGVDFVETKIPEVYDYNLPKLFDAMSPSWKEELVNSDTVFMEAVQIAKMIISREIKRAQDKLEAATLVSQIYSNSSDKRLIVLDKYYPHIETLLPFPEPLFVIFPHDSEMWRLRTVPKDPNSFVNRKNLPEKWAGKREEELEKVSGVKGAMFCHLSLWMAGAKTKEAILKMAEIALNS